VKEIYKPFSDEEISYKISEILKTNDINAEIEVIFQTISGLKKACPKNHGDWYFSGDYPTPGGRRVVNNAFVNFVEKKNKRAY
jgi:amidophosphoribosyltransferase